MECEVNYRIKDIRHQNYLTLTQLSELSGVSRSHIQAIENNKKHATVLILCLLAIALGTEPCKLYTYKSVIVDIRDK